MMSADDDEVLLPFHEEEEGVEVALGEEDILDKSSLSMMDVSLTSPEPRTITNRQLFDSTTSAASTNNNMSTEEEMIMNDDGTLIPLQPLRLPSASSPTESPNSDYPNQMDPNDTEDRDVNLTNARQASRTSDDDRVVAHESSATNTEAQNERETTHMQEHLEFDDRISSQPVNSEKEDTNIEVTTDLNMMSSTGYRATNITVTESAKKKPRKSISNHMYSKGMSSYELQGETQRDDFVRGGTRLKSLIGKAMKKIAEGRAQHRTIDTYRPLEDPNEETASEFGTIHTGGRKRGVRDSVMGEYDSPRRQKRRLFHEDGTDVEPAVIRASDKYAADLAREKVAECMALERNLREAESHSSAMVAANATLRDAASTASDRMQRTAEALKIAGVNAANARADADAAEVRAASLASHVKSFRTIVEDTRKTCDTVRSEHDEVSTATRSVNERLLQAESELIRVERDRNRAEEERDSLRERVEEMDCVQKLLQSDLDEKADELDKTKRLAADHEAIERARADRTLRIENELRESRAMLVETTSVAAETEATTAVLNDTIRELQRENKSLHVKMEETLEQSSKERKKMNEALETSESEAQKLRMKTLSDEEEIERLKLDKQEAEKSVQQMKSRLAALEKRMASNNTVIPTNYTEKAAVTPPGATEIPDGSTPPNQPFSTIQTDDNSTKGSFTIPPLRS
eukprot:scaffold7323_cov41-Attheya_sp.AAC.1